MPQFSRTWWGQRFIAALEEFTDPARLARGRSYANTGRILSYRIDQGTVTASVRGSINPYFGVYEEPIYTTTVTITPIRRADWTKLIADLAAKAGPIAKLLLNEMPDNIEETFANNGLALLPRNPHDFSTSCSCPDYYRPCKHVAGVCYLLASALDRDPFLMFELRGISREQLHAELARSPLGEILAAELQAPPIRLVSAASLFTRPTKEPADLSISSKEFWTGARRLPTVERTNPSRHATALLIKKGGDDPEFWKKDASFIGVMEELYERVRTKSAQMK